jgi:vancomycin resistance protein VanJ
VRSGRGWNAVAVALGGLLAVVLVFPGVVPNAPGRLGSLLETFRPWLGLGVPVLIGLALCRRAIVNFLAVLVPAVAWLVLFGGLLLPSADPVHDLTAVTHNVSDENADPAGTVRELIRARPDLIGLVEVTSPALADYTASLAEQYPHHAVRGTVGLWSRFPLAEVSLVDIRPSGVGAGWDRGLRAVARLPSGEVAVYVAHLPSVRIGPAGLDSARRDESAGRLGAVLAAEPLARVLLLGDLNSTVDDRGLRPVTSRLGTADGDFAFSWPAGFPVARIDQVLGRSMRVVRVWSLPATGSDHLPVAARIRL